MRAVTTTKTRAMKRARVTKRARGRRGPWRNLPRGRRETIVLLRRRGYTTINFDGEERGGDDSEGDDEGGKGDGGMSYEDDGGDGGDDDAKRR